MARLAAICLAVIAVLLLAPGIALAQGLDLPEPVGYVNDFAGLIADDTEARLEQTLRQYEQETTVEVVAVTLPDLQGTTIEDYAVRLFEKWGIGKRDVDNGVLLIVARDERDVRIEVGYGMEPYITDGQAGRILDREVVPALRGGDYTQGVANGVTAIMQTIRDSGYEPGAVRPRPVTSRIAEAFEGKAWLLWTLAGISLYVVAFMARTRSIWLGGIWGGIVGGILGGVLGGLLAILVGVAMLGLVGLLLDALLSSAYRYQKSSGRSTAWHRTWGGFSGAGRGGGGFGGFGGGRSGGGGASRGF